MRQWTRRPSAAVTLQNVWLSPSKHTQKTVCCHEPANLTAASHTSQLFSCAVPIFFFVLPQIIIIFIFIKKHFNTSKLMFVHNVWSSSCWCAMSLGGFPLITISFFSPLFSPLFAASALTGKSTLLLFISKPRRAAWLACSDCLCKGCLPKLHLKHWPRRGCNLVQGFFKRRGYSLCLADTRRMGRSHFMPAFSLAIGEMPNCPAQTRGRERKHGEFGE